MTLVAGAFSVLIEQARQKFMHNFTDAPIVRPSLSMHHHPMFSENTIAEDPKRNSFQVNLAPMVSPLPYGLARAFTPESKASVVEGGKLSLEDSPTFKLEEGKSSPPIWWTGFVPRYDSCYDYLKQKWPVYVVLLLSSIVCCSVAIGWSFRLRTFNIADADDSHNSIVSRVPLLYHIATCPNEDIRSNCLQTWLMMSIRQPRR